MKKVLLAFTLSLILSSSFSQTKWGVYGGFTISTFKNQLPANDIIVLDDYRTLETFHIGGYVEYQVLRNMFIESGIIFENRGFVNDAYYEPLEVDHGFKYQMPYVGIPLTVNYYLINKRFKLYVLAGQKTGWCFDGKRVDAGLSMGVINGVDIEDIDWGEEEIPVGKDGIYKSFNYDILYGGGIGVGRFYLVGTYSLGLNNVINSDFFDYSSRVFNLSLRIDLSNNK